MGKPSAKVLRSREHLTKLWQTRQGEKGGNQDHCCDHATKDHCCDHAAHQKFHQPIARDGKVGVSRLPEEDVRTGKVGVSRLQEEDHLCTEADLVFEEVLSDCPVSCYLLYMEFLYFKPAKYFHSLKILCHKYRRTCSFRLSWNQKTKVIYLI